MGFRDELEAAQARIGALEEELAEAKAKIEKLQLPPQVLRPLTSEEPRPRGQSLRFGAVRYHPPRTYVPFLRLYRSAHTAAWQHRPSLGRPATDAVWRWLFHNVIAVPVTYVVRIPLYFAAMCIALPVAAIVCLVATVLTAPLIALSRFSFSETPPAKESGWWHGEATTETGATFLWVLMSCVMQPLLLVTTSLLDEG